MKIEDYIQQAARFESLGRFESCVPKRPDSVLRAGVLLNHAMMGMMLEREEADSHNSFANLVEEAGDFMWFWAQAARAIEFDDFGLMLSDGHLCVQAPFNAAHAGEYCHTNAWSLAWDAVRRLLYYSQDWSVTRGHLLAALPALFSESLKVFETHAYCYVRREPRARAFRAPQSFLDLVCPINIAKLTTRYNGEQFSAERALSRDLAAEAAVLEKGVTA